MHLEELIPARRSRRFFTVLKNCSHSEDLVALHKNSLTQKGSPARFAERRRQLNSQPASQTHLGDGGGGRRSFFSYTLGCRVDHHRSEISFHGGGGANAKDIRGERRDCTSCDALRCGTPTLRSTCFRVGRPSFPAFIGWSVVKRILQLNRAPLPHVFRGPSLSRL